MTGAEAIEILKTDGCSDCSWGCETPLKCANKDCLFVKALKMAISALKQAPNENEIALKITRGALKSRQGDVVIYNVLWLKEHWQKEIEIVCGVKPCDDAISRKAVLDTTICEGISCNECSFNEIDGESGCLLHARIDELPSVQPSRKKGQWSIGVVRNDPDRKWDWRRFYCSVCGSWQTYGQTKYCPKCGAEMEVLDELQTHKRVYQQVRLRVRN